MIFIIIIYSYFIKSTKESIHRPKESGGDVNEVNNGRWENHASS